MGTTAQKLQNIIDSKAAISAAIEAKGGTVPTELSGYGPAIEALPSGCDLDKLTYVLYDDNKISGYLLEGKVAGSSGTPNQAFQNGKVVQLGNEVTSIGNDAFYGVSSLTSISIPDSVTRIGRSFWRCYGLTSISIPDSVEMLGLSTSNNYGPFGTANSALTAGAEACSNLVSVDLGNGVKIIGGGCFGRCVNLSSITIPNSVTNIKGSAFLSCSSLTSIAIPDGVTNIEMNTFNGCSGLTSVTIPNSVSSIGIAAFQSCSSLTSVTIPDSVVSLQNNAFQFCSLLSSITFGNAISAVGAGSFRECSSCTIFDFSNATVVPTLGGTGAFYNTPANKKIIVPDALYETWKTTSNWNSTTYGIVDAITKASEA